MTVMELSERELGLPTDRPLTVDDLAHTPDDGRKYELVDGRLDVSPAPAQPHVRVQHRLGYALTTAAPDDYEVQTNPGMDMNRARTHHRIPDAIVKEGQLECPHITRPPYLAVEVVSPGEGVLRDHHTKKREYAKFGIPYYWLIDPSFETPGIIELHLDDDGEYREVQQVLGTNLFETKVPFPIRIVPEWLIADGKWKDHIGGPTEEQAVENETE